MKVMTNGQGVEKSREGVAMKSVGREGDLGGETFCQNRSRRPPCQVHQKKFYNRVGPERLFLNKSLDIYLHFCFFITHI